MKLSALKPQFSIRTMLVLMTLLAIFLAYHLNWLRQRRELIAAGKVFSDLAATQRAPGILFLFGERGHEALIVAKDTSDADIVQLQQIFPEANFQRQTFTRMGTRVNTIRIIPKQTP